MLSVVAYAARRMETGYDVLDRLQVLDAVAKCVWRG